MDLSDNDLIRIYFLTHTAIPGKTIINLASSYSNINDLAERVKKINNPDLDSDWALYDFNYKSDKLVFAQNIKIIKEKDIFQGTYIHRCKNEKKFLKRYLIQITGEYGYCKRCDTQFFPELWWKHPEKKHLNYFQIKYGKNIQRKNFNLHEKYINKLLSLKTDIRVLKKAISKIHSPMEIEKILKTKYYDRNNPPLPVKIHAKLIYLINIWTIRPVKHLGICPSSKFFFHRCANNVEKILFEEKNLYSWCPGCYTKFIPVWDKNTINKYKGHFTVETYTEDKYDNKININNYDFTEKNIYKKSPEYFYLSVLGLKDRVSIHDINDTFRKLSKIYHPDFGGSSDMFQKIVKAKNWLIKFYKQGII